MMSEVLELDVGSRLIESFNEFDQPSPLRRTFCRKITEEEYEEQAAEETEKALKVKINNLLEHKKNQFIC